MSLDLDGLTLAPDLADVLMRLTAASADLAKLIARHGLAHDLAATAGTNSDGDGQKALDVIADEAFMAALRGSAVAHYASEEQDEVVSFGPGTLALAIDPLDGSSNIDVNVSIGTIFSVFPAADTPLASFLRKGTEQIAAGYVIYGPQCALVLATAGVVHEWLLDPETGRFERIADPAPMAPETSEFAINASNYRHWLAPVRAFIDDLMAGTDGPRGRNFNMRWIASLVAETHRILRRGGVFLYPADARKGYERGRLRHVYECAPIAYVMAAAGGAASDGTQPILEIVPSALHERTPFIFGTASKVARVTDYHDQHEG